MTRKPAVVGNWKMELSHKGALELVRALKKLLAKVELTCDVVVCPSYPSLADVAAELKKSGRIAVGAQHVHWEDKGPWTGQVSVTQIAPFVSWCIVGHSEQRELVGLTEEEVRLQTHILINHGIIPIVCIGETASEQQADRTVEKITSQANSLFQNLTRVSLSKLVIAYEPIWAIGTGVTPEASSVAEIALLIRKIAASKFGNEAAQRLCILYGGSVTPDTVGPYVAEPGIDGVLVGGASVHPMQFVGIIKAVQEATQ